MGNEALSPALKFEYRFLKQQVDRLQDELGRRDRPKNTEQDSVSCAGGVKIFCLKVKIRRIAYNI